MPCLYVGVRPEFRRCSCPRTDYAFGGYTVADLNPYGAEILPAALFVS
jgi:hypothetical protein